jgi:hypothetical protein
MDMRIYISSKEQAYLELKAVNEVHSVQAKNRELIANLQLEGTFIDVIEFWQKTNTTVESQIQNSKTLSTSLIAAYVKNKGLTVGTRNQMNAALTLEDVDKRVQAGIAASAAKYAEATCATCKVKVMGKNKLGRPLKYCNKCYAKFKADRAVT